MNYTVGDYVWSKKTTLWKVSQRTIFLKDCSYEIKKINAEGVVSKYLMACEYDETIYLTEGLMQDLFGEAVVEQCYDYAMGIL